MGLYTLFACKQCAERVCSSLLSFALPYFLSLPPFLPVSRYGSVLAVACAYAMKSKFQQFFTCFNCCQHERQWNSLWYSGTVRQWHCGRAQGCMISCCIAVTFLSWQYLPLLALLLRSHLIFAINWPHSTSCSNCNTIDSGGGGGSGSGN